MARSGSTRGNLFLSLLVTATVLTSAGTGCVGGPEAGDVEVSSEALCSSSTLVSNDTDYTSAAGPTITWTASAGCTGTAEYEFWVLAPGAGAWALAQSWSTTATYAWDTTGLAAGAYYFQVWARDGGGSWESYADRSFAIVGAGPDPCTSATVTTSPTGAGSVGQSITVNAGATCGASTPEYRVWTLEQGGSWNLLADWSTTASAIWTPAGAGTHYVQVWVRALGSAEAYQAFAQESVALSAPCSAVSVTASPVGTTQSGNTVTLTAVGTCGGTANYAFWVLPPGGSWTQVRAMGASPEFAWDTTGLAAGDYYFNVFVRNQGATATYESWTDLTYSLTSGTPCTAAGLSAAPSNTVTAGTTVTLTGSASNCGVADYRFWRLAPGGTWTEVQAMGASASWVWDTTGFALGTYRVEVWIRQNGSTVPYETWADADIVVQ